MADKPSKAEPAKRKVKNPETFRERALKATVESDKPKQRARVGGLFAWLLRPLRSAGRAVVNFPLFKPLRWPLRIIGLIIFPKYFRNSFVELKQVTWPTWKESLRLTWAVLLFAIIFGTAVALVDYGLDAVFKRILLK
jgi:preprotein translocase SecE subunit